MMTVCIAWGKTSVHPNVAALMERISQQTVKQLGCLIETMLNTKVNLIWHCPYNYTHSAGFSENVLSGAIYVQSVYNHNSCYRAKLSESAPTNKCTKK